MFLKIWLFLPRSFDLLTTVKKITILLTETIIEMSFISSFESVTCIKSSCQSFHSYFSQRDNYYFRPQVSTKDEGTQQKMVIIFGKVWKTHLEFLEFNGYWIYSAQKKEKSTVPYYVCGILTTIEILTFLQLQAFASHPFFHSRLMRVR